MSAMLSTPRILQHGEGKSRGILHLRSTWSKNGSVEQQIRAMIREMDTTAWIHHVGKIEPMIPVHYGSQAVEDNILTPHEVGLHRWHRIPWEWTCLLSSGITALQNILRAGQIDLIHCHDNRANLLGLAVGRWTGVPVIASLYGWVRTSIKLRFLALVDAYLLRFANAIIATSGSMVPLVPKVSRSKIAVIHNGIDTASVSFSDQEVQELRRELGLHNGDLVVATVGRLSLEKGQSILIQAAEHVCRQLPNTKFVLVGHGPMYDHLARQVASLNLSGDVIFTGHLDDRRLAIVRSLSDLIALPSLSESLPLALLEGMAYGRPAVATQVGDVEEVVVPGETGVLVPPGSVQCLADGITMILSQPNQRRRMGQQAAQIVRERFSSAAMVRRVEETYRSVLAQDACLA